MTQLNEQTRILKLNEVIHRTALSSTTIYRLVSLGEFPKQVKLSERSSGWLESEVNQWIEKRVKASRDGEAA